MQTQVSHPPQTAPGLGPPRTWNGARYSYALLKMPNEVMTTEYSLMQLPLVGTRRSRAAPGRGDSLLLLSLTPELLNFEPP